MPVSASHFRSAHQATELNGPRIAAISATLSVHVTAFLFLMAPIAMPDWVAQPETVTEIILRDPPKPEPVVLPPKPLAHKPVQARQNSVPQTAVARTSTPVDASADSLADDIYVPISDVGPSESPVQEGGGDVDASTRARYPIDYPVAALRAGLAGTVTVLARYDANGTVMETRVHKSSRNADFDRAALRGVKKWKINPSEINGQAIGGEALVDVVFRL
jgi:periplasmic protein TonB